MTFDSKNITFTEEVEGKIVEYSMIETWDGLYAPVAIRKPEGDGPFPIVLLAAGNGGEGLAWLMDAVRNRAYTMDRLVDAVLHVLGCDTGLRLNWAIITEEKWCVTCVKVAKCLIDLL